MKTLLSVAALSLLLALPVAAQTRQTTPAPAAPTPAPSSKPMASQGQPININTASKEELDTLKGIGEKRADAIIKNRPYNRVSDLQDRRIIPSNVYNDIKDMITVGAATGRAPADSGGMATTPRKETSQPPPRSPATSGSATTGSGSGR